MFQLDTPALAPAMSEEQFRRRLLATLSAGFVILAIVSAMAVWLISRASDYSRWVGHTYTVQQALYRLQNDFERVEGSRRGFLLTGDTAYLTNYQQAATALPQTLESLRALTGDNPRQQRRLAQLEPAIAAKIKISEDSILRARGGDRPGAEAMFAAQDDYRLNGRIRDVISALHDEETRLLDQRSERENANRALLLIVVLASSVFLVILGGASLWVVRRYAGDLQQSEERLRQMNEGLDAAVRERTADLIRANEEIQRFAYIVSHDLRAPLVNVMGFTSELDASLKDLRDLVLRVESDAPQVLSPGAKFAVESDIPESLGFIRSSTQKMDRLINAILKLSREGRRTLAPEPLDMNAVMRQIAATLRHQADARGAEIVLEDELPEVVSDRLAIEQVFANIIENAIKYLKPGRPGRIVVRGRPTPTRLIYEIEDNGRGVDPKDHERIFDLFRRAGAQDQPGEGIGLAHVRATVSRLGGTVTVDSELDRGATFRISLPRAPARDQELAA